MAAAVTSRYSRAFADVVFDRKLDPRTVMQQLNGLVSVVKENEILQRIWETPSIPAEQKRALLDAIVARESVLPPVRNFLAVLIDHHRIDALADIARGVESELDSRLGFAEAEITSARELTAAEKEALENKIAGLTGRKVRAHYATDGKLLGGAIVRVGSTIYDGSVKGQLRRMKEALSS